jgi:hypothetical protein
MLLFIDESGFDNSGTPVLGVELLPYAAKLHDMQFHGQKPRDDGNGVWQLQGITYIDDLRPQRSRGTGS